MTDDSGARAGGHGGEGRAGAERRRSHRVPVEMWVEELAEDERVFRRAGNLSEGGLHLDKTIPIPVGSAVHLRFTLPGDTQAVEVKGVVVAIDAQEELGMGVKFVELPESARSLIKHYLDRALTPIG